MKDINQVLEKFTTIMEQRLYAKKNIFADEIYFKITCNVIWKANIEQYSFTDVEMHMLDVLSNEVFEFVYLHVNEKMEKGLKHVPYPIYSSMTFENMHETLGRIQEVEEKVRLLA